MEPRRGPNIISSTPLYPSLNPETARSETLDSALSPSSDAASHARVRYFWRKANTDDSKGSIDVCSFSLYLKL